MIRTGLPLILCLCFFTGAFQQQVHAQDQTNNTFGKGIKTFAIDSTFSLKFSTRIQTRYEGSYIDREEDRYSDQFYLRRSRFKFDGFVLNPKLVYKIEYDIVSREMLDAVIKWNFYKNLSLWYGQTKLPGNIERVISSQKLQFVDRSLLNSRYNIDRDKGLQLRHHFTIGNMLIREKLAVSKGEGKNFRNGGNTGHDYTGRIELLPMGAFSKKGEYFASDLQRESTPKLMIAATYDFNDDAIREEGQRGDVLPDDRDIATIFADLAFKYSGISVIAEYAHKEIYNGSPLVTQEGETIGSYYTGEGFNAQLGYLFKSNFELACRYAEIVPEEETGNANITQYTLGTSKYIVGHSLKIQTDLSYTTEDDKDDTYLYRLQVELAF